MFIVAKTKNLLSSLKSRISHSKNKKVHTLLFAAIVLCVPLVYFSSMPVSVLLIPLVAAWNFTRPEVEQVIGGICWVSALCVLLYLQFVLGLSLLSFPAWFSPELFAYFFSCFFAYVFIQLFYLLERIEPKVTAFLQPILEPALTKASIAWILTKGTLQNLNAQLQPAFLLAKRVGKSVVWTIKIILRPIIWFVGPFKPVPLVCVRILRLFVPETLIMGLTCILWIVFFIPIAIRAYPFSFLFTEWLILELAVWLLAYIVVRVLLLFMPDTKITQ